MYEKLLSIIETYKKLNEELMNPDIASDISKMTQISKKIKNMEEIYNIAKQYVQAYNEKKEALEILKSKDTDKDTIELAEMQLQEANDKLVDLEQKAKVALLPKDENDDKNIYLEIRPAAWWDEAWLFAAELLRAYILYAQKQWWKIETIEQQLTDIGWIKLAVVKISWDNVYSKLKRESWVHRVQRVPETESQWRVHTSTVTVAIMPEIDDVQVEINEKDIEIDTFAASSAWWQNANKNQTWVRLHHKPTWIIVTIGDSKSQLKNKEKAFNILKAKLYQIEQDKKQQQTRELRSNQIWTWDRSEKIRTYNYPQDRVTDHRIKKSWSNLPAIMSWDLDDIFDSLNLENQTKLLAAIQESE